MRRIGLTMASIPILAITALPACSDDSDGDGGEPSKVIVVTEDITETTTWKTGFIYLIEASNMHVSATLTIEPGVIVKFNSDKGSEMLLGDNGTIVAKGTLDEPIVFTSYKDDAQGGDTNEDADATTPAAGDWHNVNLNGRSGSTFEHCQFYYGGASSNLSSLSLEAGSVATVKDCLFVHNKGGKSGDFWYGALNGADAGSGTVIESNTFFDNDLPLSVDITYSLDDSNVFFNPADATQGNKLNGVFVSTSGDIDTALSWGETEVAFVINDNDLWIEDGGSLTLADNVVLKFTTESTLVYDGTNLTNHDGTDVQFTSFKDDLVKGDTNGDADATEPADGDWEGIYNDSESVSDYESWSNIHYDSH